MRCEQCDTTGHDFLVKTWYRWTEQVAGENPEQWHYAYLCTNCHGQLERMARVGMAKIAGLTRRVVG